MADPESSSSSFTAKEPVLTSNSPDVESQQGRNNPSHWFLVCHPDGVTDAVLNHAYPGHGTPESPYVVDFLIQDGSNPMQYSRTKKWTITLLQALATLAVAFVSTAYSGGVYEIIRYFHVSTIVAILGVSLFVLGFAIGPLLWAPLSEFHGRQIVFFFTYFGLAAFSAGAAGAQNIHTLIILRFFAGAFGASPLTNSGGVIADMFNAKVVAQQIRTTLLRPWVLLFTEPIVFLTAIYLAIVYGTLYLLFAAFPIVFQLNRGWSAGVGGLAFIGVAVGMLFAVAYSMFDNRRYGRVAAASPGGLAPPEARLPPAIIGSVLLPVGLFWFAWTNGPEVHWVVPITASAFFAAGLVSVFLSLLTYMIDSYTVFAASVLAANSVLRSLFGAAFPLFTTYMYQDLGIHWASTVPAFLALACMPFPWLFWKYGARIRSRCRYAAEAAAVLQKMMQAANEQQERGQQGQQQVVAPVNESPAVLSEDEGTVVGDGEEVKENRK
ncbi:major facilitator superfamily domain-containing protein [Chaetomium tenue]|uniref:Major facilitator superfamily domain-containing protein n=1 Tax=Chaetomium tenue TaxID=1854479 RepID=A0ACB7PDZ5_9PEZI|nr:major facilitator superfamily domain-containing protein [Chaetomium globosum]